MRLLSSRYDLRLTSSVAIAIVFTVCCSSPTSAATNDVFSALGKNHFNQGRLEPPPSSRSRKLTFFRKENGNSKLGQLPTAGIFASVRGGGSNSVEAASSSPNIGSLYGKLAIGVLLESSVLAGILKLGHFASQKLQLSEIAAIFKLFPQIASLLLIVFASSLIGSLIQNGMSLTAAGKQALNPVTVPANPDWYANLKKPSWNPPGWVFPIMWLIVSKPTQLASLVFLLTKKTTMKLTDSTEQRIVREIANVFPLKIIYTYCVHLALGNCWNRVFFDMQYIGHGTVVITLFFNTLIRTFLEMKKSYPQEPIIGNLMIPTCAWVTVATCLQWSIFLLNKSNARADNAKNKERQKQ